MAYTFLEITNLALREVNEVPLTQQLFLTSRGLQQFAKEAVNRSFFDISNESTKWPWLQDQVANTANTEVTKVNKGQVWYEINPLTIGNKVEVEWDTFLITDKDLQSVDPLVIASVPKIARSLQYITYEEWMSTYRAKDFDKQNSGVPSYVIRYPSGKFGMSPSPDKDYWVEYNVSNSAIRFTEPNTEIPFPEAYLNVLVSRCAYYLWKFRENLEQANMAKGEYRDALTNMKRILLSNKEERMRAT